MSQRFYEFFEVKGVYSMRNLTVFIGVFIGSLVVLILTAFAKLTAEIFGIYMFATGGVYGFGKWQDDKTRRSEIESTVEPTPVNNVTVNQPGNVNMPPPLSQDKA